MSKTYDRIEYVGKAKYLLITIYPSGREYKLSADNPYKFQPSDIIDKISLKYYKSLYNMGLRLVESDQEFTEKKFERDPSESPVSTDDAEEFNKNHPEQVIENNDLNEESTSIAEVDTSSINKDELVEFLDLNYEGSALEDVARAAGLKRISSSWDRSTLINKILDSNTEYVINLIKNS